MSYNRYICRTMRQSGELQSVSAISHKEKMKKENEQKDAKQEFMVGDLVLVDSSGSPCLPGKLNSKWTGPSPTTLVFKFFMHWGQLHVFCWGGVNGN